LRILFNVPAAKSSSGFTGDRDEPRFLRVLELPMRSALANNRPAVVLEHLHNVTNLHIRFILPQPRSICLPHF